MQLPRSASGIVLLLVLAGCGEAQPAAQAPRPAAAVSECPPGEAELVDWVPFVQHAGVH